MGDKEPSHIVRMWDEEPHSLLGRPTTPCLEGSSSLQPRGSRVSGLESRVSSLYCGLSTCCGSRKNSARMSLRARPMRKRLGLSASSSQVRWELNCPRLGFAEGRPDPQTGASRELRLEVFGDIYVPTYDSLPTGSAICSSHFVRLSCRSIVGTIRIQEV